VGVNIGEEKICILLYADDIVLLADSEDALQVLLNALNDWCGRNDKSINPDKCNVMHFQTESMTRSEHEFRCGEHIISYSDKYTYLGLLINEY
jgi:hypothetical protein